MTRGPSARQYCRQLPANDIYDQAGVRFQAGDHAGAAKIVARAAGTSNALAQLRLALLYDQGDVVPSSARAAFVWYSRAAAQGDRESQNQVALFYELGEGVPEVVLLNSHDGSSAYQLRAGLFRLVCLNGLLVSVGEIARVRVSHRGNVVDDVVSGALQMSEQFDGVANRVEQMESRVLSLDERRDFGTRALLLRFDRERALGIGSEKVLRARRVEDTGRDLWSIYNVAQEHLMRGGLRRRSASGRLGVSRSVSAIREDVRLKLQVWELAASYLTV